LLAKLQLSEFFQELVQQFDGVEIVEEPEFTPALVFRSVNALKLRFHPRSSSRPPAVSSPEGETAR
jgi:hypothetical protein